MVDGQVVTSHWATRFTKFVLPIYVDTISRPEMAAMCRSEERVVVDGQVITSRGPGTSIEFALALVKALFGAHKAAEVAGPMVVHEGISY